MHGYLASYWWLIFPIGFFVFGAWDRWLAYRRSRDQLDLIRTLAAQGKEIPPELMGAAAPFDGAPPEPPPGAPGYGPYGPWVRPRDMRWAWRRYHRYGPYWQWRGVVVTGAVAAGFWWASMDGGWPGTEGPFRTVAIILTVICAGRLVSAVLMSGFRDR